jgi:hypothetical protein
MSWTASTSMTVSILVSWVAIMCGPVCGYQHFGRTYCLQLHPIFRVEDAVLSSIMLVSAVHHLSAPTVHGVFYGRNQFPPLTTACTVVAEYTNYVLTLGCHHNPALGIELLWYKDSSGCAWEQDRVHGPHYYVCHQSIIYKYLQLHQC